MISDLAFELIKQDPIAYMRMIEGIYATDLIAKQEADAGFKRQREEKARDRKAPIPGAEKAPPEKLGLRQRRAQKKVVVTRSDNKKYCIVCEEKFTSNGWTITCPLCSAAGMGLHDRVEIFDRDNFTCVYCQAKLGDDGVILHIDHIVPVSNGGGDNAGNLVTSCRYCNCSKHNRTLADTKKYLNLVANRNQEFDIDPARIMVIGIEDADSRRMVTESRRTHRKRQNRTESTKRVFIPRSAERAF